jgi:hypothetical protein
MKTQEKIITSSYFDIPNFDALYKQQKVVLLLNDLPYVTKEDRAAFNSIIMTTYDNDVLSNVPSCACTGYDEGLKGMFNVGRLCKRCGFEVKHPSEDAIDLRTWMKVPDGIKGFIIPVVWVQLTNLLNPTSYNLLVWLTDSKSIPPLRITKDTKNRILYFESIGWKRGLNSFIENFDQFLDILAIMTKKKKRAMEYINYLSTVKDRLFPQYLPMPNKALLVLENTQIGAFADRLTVTGAIDAARNIASLSMPRSRPFSIEKVEGKVVSIIGNLVSYYTSSIKNTLCSKKGWLRGQLFSSRSHFCLRAVITSLTDPHRYDELYIPWAQGLELLKVHIISILLKRGYSFSAAANLVESSGNVYVPLLDEIMEKIINDSKIPYSVNNNDNYDSLLNKPFDFGTSSGISSIFQRNPSMGRLSAQNQYITGVKKDVLDRTISMSPLATKGPNADFDGDEMNLYLLMDQRMQEAGKLLESHYGIHNQTILGELNDAIDLPDVTISIISNFMNYDN